MKGLQVICTTLLSFCTVQRVLSVGLDLTGVGLCSDMKIVRCPCGNTGTTVNVKLKQCLHFYRWKPYCKPCQVNGEDVNEDDLCHRRRFCLTCSDIRDGACDSCPPNRYGRECERICQCQNGGSCNQVTGMCFCTDAFTGTHCENKIAPAVVCPLPTHPANGQFHLPPGTLVINPGVSVSYSCNHGYRLSHGNNRQCNQNGQLSGSAPSCIAITTSAPTPTPTTAVTNCPLRAFPENSKERAGTELKPQYIVGERIFLECVEGYHLTRDQYQTCQADGTWSAGPTCVKVSGCKDDGISENMLREVLTGKAANSALGRRRSRIGFGDRRASRTDPVETAAAREELFVPEGYFKPHSVITYTCKKYYKLHGSARRQCLGNGRLTGHRPTCVTDCGKKGVPRQPFVTNGNVTQLGQYPWQVALYRKIRGKGFTLICGGALISKTWIATAAHCVTYRDNGTVVPAEDLKVKLGKYYRSDAEDDANVKTFLVEEVIVHDQFEFLSLDADIALIRLPFPGTEFTDRILPVCLPTVEQSERHIKPTSVGTITGWGRTENGQHSEVLREATVPVVDSVECEDEYFKVADLVIPVTSYMFCAGYAEGRVDSCSGDSGGPFVFHTGEGANTRWQLEGLVSWGSPDGCGLPKQYGGYTRVSKFLNWIQKRVL